MLMMRWWSESIDVKMKVYIENCEMAKTGVHCHECKSLTMDIILMDQREIAKLHSCHIRVAVENYHLPIEWNLGPNVINTRLKISTFSLVFNIFTLAQ